MSRMKLVAGGRHAAAQASPARASISALRIGATTRGGWEEALPRWQHHRCHIRLVKEKSILAHFRRCWLLAAAGALAGMAGSAGERCEASLAPRLLHRLFQPGGSEHRDGWMRSAVQEVPSRPHVAVGRRPAKRRRLAYAPSPLQIHPMFSLSAKSNLRKTTTNQVPPRLSLCLSGAYASPPQQPPRLGNDGPELAAGRGRQSFTQPRPPIRHLASSSSQAQRRSGIPLAITAIALDAAPLACRGAHYLQPV